MSATVLTLLCLLTLWCHGADAAGGGNTGLNAGQGGDFFREKTCPPAKEISPCYCKIMSKGI